MQEKRNVVLVNFNLHQQKLIIEDNKKIDKFPKMVFVNTLEEALKHQGFLLVVKQDDMPINLINFDINNRYKFRKYNQVIFCIKNYHYNINFDLTKYSHISFMPYDYIYNLNPDYFIRKYTLYLDTKEKKKTAKRLKNIELLNNYLKGKRYVTTENIANNFKVSIKWVERYMQDVNEKYHNIGFDIYNKRWYIVKKK